MVDPYGALLPGERQLYKPWGEKRLNTSISLTRVGYTGQYDQAEIGLMFYQARWYDAELGRWASPDSIVPLATQGTQALDRYAYANNNPIRFNDPSGHSLWDVIGQFSTGYVREFTLRNVGWVSPKAQADLGVDATETTAELAGRVVADAATIILGIDNLLGGAAIASGGSVVACGVTACLGAAATTTAGAAIAVVGVAQTAQGAMGLGGNLALLANKTGSKGDPGFGVFEKNGIKTADHFFDRLDDWGITEKQAFGAYQNGKKFTDELGQFIRWDPKLGIAMAIDPTDGTVISVWETRNASSNWTMGWLDDYGY